MELVVVLSVLAAGAAAAALLVILLRRRRAERLRARGEEMHALDKRISERLGELMGRGRSRPDMPRAIKPVSVAAIEPVAVATTEPVAVEAIEPVAAATIEPVAVAAIEPVSVAAIEPVSVAAIEPQITSEGLAPPQPLPVTGARKPRPMRTGRARPQAVATTAGTRRRLVPRDMLVALAVIVLFVFAGSQLLGSAAPSGGGTPTPTDVTGLVPTGTTTVPPTSEPTLTPGETAAATGTLGEPTPTPRATSFVYIVRRGDTMSKIAADFGVTLEDLIAANPQIEDPSLIYAGNVITLPPGASPTASAVP
jgi:LysM repeat protein